VAVRATMASLILRVRLLINDPPGASQIFADNDIQDVLDESRQDVFNMPLKPQWTFSGTTPQVIDYETDLGGWEDGYVIKQYLTVVVTPTTLEPIAGHWGFAANTYPPCFITGRLYDVYRAAADLLVRYAGRWVLAYSMNVDGQSLQRNQVQRSLRELATEYRKMQRAGTISVSRSDLGKPVPSGGFLGPREIDRMASG
jgi:hypothetical protein